MRNIQSCAALFVLSLVAFVPACDGGDGESGGTTTTTPQPASLWDEMVECGVTGDFVVTSPPESSCSDWPAAYEVIAVEGEGDAVTLRAGLLRLPVSRGQGECLFVAEGCESVGTEPGSPETQRYFAPRIEIRRTGEGVRLAVQAVDVVETQAGWCAGEFEIDAAQAAEGCGPLGAYTTDTAALVSGECGLSWGPGEVSVSQDGSGHLVDWAGTTMDHLALDPASCTLKGAKGTSPNFWSYNGVGRQAEIDLVVSPTAIDGTVTDFLEGPTFDGVTCPGATFELHAHRPSREPRTLDAACDSGPPPVCGDSVCEEGESCECAECACAGGQECVFQDKTCRTPCTLQTEGTACGAGQRCSAVYSDYVFLIFPNDKLYCEAEGAGEKGDPCKATSDCGAGLICHVPVFKTSAYCTEPCGNDFPACPAGQQCAQAGDGSGSGSYPTAVRGCEP